jgi:hypothetical protein
MREHTSNANWPRNGVATWNGTVYQFDSRRPKPFAKAEAEPAVPEPVPAPVRVPKADSAADRLLIKATAMDEWSQGEWLLSDEEGPRRVSGLDESGTGWGIEFGTGRRVRMRHWRFVAE